jgi:hypothetical protein
LSLLNVSKKIPNFKEGEQKRKRFGLGHDFNPFKTEIENVLIGTFFGEL